MEPLRFPRKKQSSERVGRSFEMELDSGGDTEVQIRDPVCQVSGVVRVHTDMYFPTTFSHLIKSVRKPRV